MIRTVTEKVYRPDGNPWVGGEVSFRFSGSFALGEHYPAFAYVKTRVQADGSFTVQLWANEDGETASVYTCRLPSGEEFTFTVPAGDPAVPLSLSLLRQAGVTPLDPQYETLLTEVRTEVEAQVAPVTTGLADHLADIANPHGVTAVQVGAQPVFHAEAYGALIDGATDDTAAWNAAVTAANAAGGGIVTAGPGTSIASGITPANDVTIYAPGVTLRLPVGAPAPIITYNDDAALVRFNLFGITFEGNGVAQNLVSIDQPNPLVPNKTWEYSVVSGCRFTGSGAIGLYCPIPGSVTVENCRFDSNDIGIAWDREHFYIRDTYIASNRIGVRATGNHFTASNMVLAHNTEAGWSTTGAGLGTYSNVYEAAFIGCTAIDNPIQFGGLYERCRFTGCRIIEGGTGIESALNCTIVGNYFRLNSSWAIGGLRSNSVVTGNYFESSALTGGGGVLTTSAAAYFRVADNLFRGFQSAAGVHVLNGNTYSVEHNTFESCANPIVVETPKERFRIIGNKIRTCTVGLHVMTSATQVDDFTIECNEISAAQEEGILCEVPSSFGSSVSGNQIVDANLANTGHSAMQFATAFTAGLMKDNRVRNTASGLAQYAIEFTTSSATDLIFDGNVSRNMKAASAFKIPAAATTGTNVGTITAS